MPPSPRTRTKEETTRENVVRAAQRLFQQYGLHKVTMDNVAAVTFLSRTAVHGLKA